MKRIHHVAHRFVRSVPEKLELGVIYISIEYATAIHLCACGCGREVVTPLSPRDWWMKFDGESISLSPSIGNWNYPCRSHYYIRDNCVLWLADRDDKLKPNGDSTERKRRNWYDWFMPMEKTGKNRRTRK